MSYTITKTLFTLLILVSSITIYRARPLIFSLVTVFVENNLPRDSPSLVFHCASGDDDLGYHTLTHLGQEYHFEFSILPKTLFFCHLWWNGKDIAFDVFNAKWTTHHCARVPGEEICYWQAREDGIYLSKDYNPPTNFIKKYSW
ncbi:hypothetical protein CASFOL_005688 [Castilleja foliolosa]|uniref:S-protein homolog n=1 Tax=Castilleja foliolosa TaxID=1961234 RepID=A0ABD3E855_9LAMI